MDAFTERGASDRWRWKTPQCATERPSSKACHLRRWLNLDPRYSVAPKIDLSSQKDAMTTPTERTRNLVQAGTFLKAIRSDELLPAPLRDEAHRLLRHFPTWDEIQMLAGQSGMLTNEFDPDWPKGSRFKAHN